MQGQRNSFLSLQLAGLLFNHKKTPIALRHYVTIALPFINLLSFNFVNTSFSLMSLYQFNCFVTSFATHFFDNFCKKIGISYSIRQPKGLLSTKKEFPGLCGYFLNLFACVAHLTATYKNDPPVRGSLLYTCVYEVK